MAETQTYHPEIGSQRAFNSFVATHPNNEKGPGRHRATNEKPRHEAKRKVAERAFFDKSITEHVDQSMSEYDRAVQAGVTPQEFFTTGVDKNVAPAVITALHTAKHRAEGVNPWFATKADREADRVATVTNGEAFDSIVNHAEELEAPVAAADITYEPTDNNDLDLPTVMPTYERRGPSTQAERARHDSYVGQHVLDNPYEERRRYRGRHHVAEPAEAPAARHEQ